jgi:hypothetical protein
LGVIQITDEDVFEQVERGQIIARIYGDPGTAHNGYREVFISLSSIGRI